MDIWADIKQTFIEGSALTRLIYINLGVFLVIKLTGVFFFLMNHPIPLIQLLAVPSDLTLLVRRFWTPVTYMFYHTGFIHLLFNILGLYWFGKLFLNYFESDKLLSVYLMGGISGALSYIMAFNLFPAFKPVSALLLGASASVLALLTAVAVYDPQKEIHLFFIGRFRLKYIAVFYVLLSIIGISASNPGGNIAHLGGIAWGWFYIVQLGKGKDYGAVIIKLLNKVALWFKPKSKLKVTYKQPPRDDYEYNRMKNQRQEEINKILDKIAKSGYDSLTKKEKEILFKRGEE